VITGAAVCPCPPLLIRELSGREPVLPELRDACAEAAGRLARMRPSVIIIAGSAAVTAEWDPGDRLDLSAFAPALRAAGKPGLPPSLGIGALLLDQAEYSGARILQAIGEDEPATRCLRLGAELASSDARAAMLVMGDGSARRSPAAPGSFDERAAAFDAGIERAVRDGDLGALAAVDAALARELMATGRPAWQVLAGAMPSARPVTEVMYADAPFGVAYLVALFGQAARQPDEAAEKENR
jgi:hypothetical protein